MVLQENMLPVLPGNDYGMKPPLAQGSEKPHAIVEPVHEEDEEVVLFVEARVPCPVSEPCASPDHDPPCDSFAACRLLGLSWICGRNGVGDQHGRPRVLDF